MRGDPSVNLLKLVPAIKVLFSNKVTHLSHLLTTVSGSSNVFIYFLKHRSEVTMKMIIVSESDNQMHLNDKIDCFASFGICDDIDTLTFWLSRWWNAQIAPTTNTYNHKHVCNQLNFCSGLHGSLSDDRVLWQASDIHRDGKHDGGKKTCWGCSLMTTMVISLWSLWSSRFPWLVSTQPEACIGLQSGGTTICMWAQFKSQRLWQNQDPVKIFLSLVTTRFKM